LKDKKSKAMAKSVTGCRVALPLCGLAMAGLTLLLTGCTTGKQSGNAGTTEAGASAIGSKATGNVLRYALISEPTTLDPAKVEDGTTIDLLQNVFEGLVKWDEKNNIVPSLCEKWDLSPDGATYTFHLRTGVKFQKNGREMTADDFKYSFERACDPKTASPVAANYLGDIKGATDRIQGKATDISGVKVVDPHTLEITLNGFKPYWLGNMTYPCTFVVCKEEIVKTNGEVNENSAIGTGPFVLSRYTKGGQVSLTANPDYYAGKPKLDGIERPIILDGGTRFSSYEAGELDIVDVSAGNLDHINSDPKLKDELKAFPRAATWYVALNQDSTDSPFKKKEVRQAFAHAIDPEAIVRVALKGQADIATGIVPPNLGDYTSTCKLLAYDPAQAKKLLAQAGYPDGKGFPKLPITYRDGMPQVGSTVVVIAEQLKQNLGIEVQPQPMPWGDFLKERTAKTMPLSHLRWGADYADPQNYLSLLLHTSKKVNGKEDHEENGVGYSNPEFDARCDKADVEHDHAKRMALYQQAEQIAVNDAPWVPLYFQRDVELVKPRVKNIRDSLFGHLPYTTTTVQ
jgi:oligopeptide transport system substrate-binding protein